MAFHRKAAKHAATRILLTARDYRAKIAARLKWCSDCKMWHPHSAFGPDRSRRDGLDIRCRKAHSRRSKDFYQRRDQTLRGIHRSLCLYYGDGHKRLTDEQALAKIADLIEGNLGWQVKGR
jgi:hypothetical protein